jgi:L-aminopeptidase/D-esterase-like protein
MEMSRRSMLRKSALTFMALSSGGVFARAQEAGAKTGPLNLITDVVGLRVGNVHDSRLRSGITAVLFDQSAVAAVDVRGGGPGSRETDLLAPENTVQVIDALVLSGGSAFGLDAAGGVQARLREQGRGFAVRSARVPIVPAAALFDLLNGGDKQWGLLSPYRDFGVAAVDAAGRDFVLGSAGAGFGATTADLRGGLGSASAVSPDGYTVGALVAVNAVGQTTIGDGPQFWAAPYEIGSEFGGLGWPVPFPSTALALRTKGHPSGNTTIGVVATDAILTKPQARRLAVAAQDGLARAIRPVHTPLDGDTVFAAATGARAVVDSVSTLASLGALAADVLARAVARGIYMAASSVGLADMPPSWKDRFRS